MKRILVTGVGSGGHGEQVLKALSLAATGKYVLFGADANPHTRSKFVATKVHALPLANSPHYKDAVFELARELGVDAVFHGSEPELAVLSKMKDKFERAGIFLATNKPDLVEIGLNKDLTCRTLKELGFQVPRFWLITEGTALDVVDEYPVVVKPYLGGGGSRDVFIAQNFRDLEAIALLLGFFDIPCDLFVQKYVGSADAEFTVGVLNSPEGKLIGSVAMKRDLTSTLSVRSRIPNRTSDLSLGEYLTVSSGVSQGRIDDFPEVRREAELIAQRLGSAGPLNIQCRVVDKRIYVFEINPRFSGTTSARALVGFNEPDLFLDSYFSPKELPGAFKIARGILSRNLTESLELLET